MLQYLENGSILKLACLNKRFAAIVKDLKGFGLIWKMKSLQEVLSTAEQDEALLKCAGFSDSEIIDPLYQYMIIERFKIDTDQKTEFQVYEKILK